MDRDEFKLTEKTITELLSKLNFDRKGFKDSAIATEITVGFPQVIEDVIEFLQEEEKFIEYQLNMLNGTECYRGL